MCQTVDIAIRPGKTFEETFFYASDELEHKTVQAVTSVVPLRLHVPVHELPGGTWLVTIKSERSPYELGGEGVLARTIDSDHIELSEINPSDWPWPKAGTPLVLAYPKPIDLTGWAFRGQMRDRVGGNLLFSWHSNPGENPDGLILISESRFTLRISPDQSSAMSFNRAVYDIEAVTPSGDVLSVVDISAVKLEQDVTAWPTD